MTGSSEGPPPVEIRLRDRVRQYWLKRVAQHMEDSYAGLPMWKFPEDLRVYEHLLWTARPNVVLELGAAGGGSTLWFRDRLRTLAAYGHIDGFRVISVDLEIDPARRNLARVDPTFDETITMIAGDVRDPALAGVVADRLPAGARCFVVEDTAHIYETTMAALVHYAALVPLHGFFVVEDGCVDVEAMRLDRHWPRGVLPALDEWLQTPQGAQFTVRRDLEMYGLSCHPQGFLERTGEPA